MVPLLVLLATFAALVGSSALLATLGGHRRRRRRMLADPEREQLEQKIGAPLADLVDAAIDLSEQSEDARAIALEMLALDRHFGVRLRPLWRQIEDAKFGHMLGRMREQLLAWLERFDALSSTDRQLVELLDLRVTAIRELAEGTGNFMVREPVRNHVGRMQALTGQLKRARTCLVHFERRLIDHRTSGYR
ncbi:hypothetical protein ACNOYE_16230 [Nannocystaceae bacterium ST9]